MLDMVKYHWEQFEGEFSSTNVFKGRPRPESDEAWDRVGRLHLMPVADEHRAEMNKTDSGISYPEEQGGGLMVEIEVFHQLHCLVSWRYQPTTIEANRFV